MLRLLIVDNEEIIVNHLFEVFRSMSHLSLDVYKAYSGEEAIEWLDRTRMDIVLTDIDMPNINGIQLMEEIFKRWPQCKVIFLTGHSEFTYVYQAIQHPGVTYLLKVEDIDKVIQVVEDTASKIRKEIKTGDLIREAKENIQMALELFQEDYLLRLLKGNKSISVTQEQFEQLSIALSSDEPVILALGKIDSDLEEFNYMSKIQNVYAVKQMIKRYISMSLRSVIILDDNYHFILLIQPKDKESFEVEDENERQEHTLQYLKGMLESIQQSCADKLNQSISFTMGNRAICWDEVVKHYNDLQSLLNYRIGNESSMLIIEHNIKLNSDSQYTDNDIKQADGEENENKALSLASSNVLLMLEQYLEAGQREKYFNELEPMLKSLCCISNKKSLIAQQVFCSISLFLLSYINRFSLQKKLYSKFGEIQLVNTTSFINWGEAANYLRELSTNLFDLQTLEQKKRADNIISYVQQFILSHLGEDLSLVRLSEQVYLNPSYLSRLFKRETKRNLTEFIDASRIQKAKELLSNDSVKINEVARQVGYETATSFTRFFKNITGLSPQEYRDCKISK